MVNQQPLKAKKTCGNAPIVAIVGCGAIAESFHLPALTRHPALCQKLILVDRNVERARALVRNNPKVLFVRRSSIGLLNFTPKIVDALLGKLPGAIAEMAANLGDSYLEDRRRIVVYDFGNIMLHGTLSYVARMFHESEGSAQTEEKPTS